MPFLVTYNQDTHDVLGLTFTSESADTVVTNGCVTIEVTELVYKELQGSHYGAYWNGVGFKRKPVQPDPFHVWDCRAKRWALDSIAQLNGMTIDVRETRDARLKALDAVVGNPLRWASLTETKQQEYADYRQQLLNVPQQSGFPLNVVWPVVPT